MTQDRREGLFQVPAEVAGTPTRVSRPLEDCEGCPVLAGVRNPRSGLIPAQLFRFTLQFRRPQQQGRVERLQRAEPGPLKRGCTGRTGRRAEWQALAECVARGGEHAPDTPKSKRALRFRSLADPMPRSLPALPGRQAVPPYAATSTVSQAAGQAASELVETHRRENWKSTLAAPRVLITIFDSSHRH